MNETPEMTQSSITIEPTQSSQASHEEASSHAATLATTATFSDAGSSADEQQARSNTSSNNNNNKRPLMTHSKDGKQLSEKKLRRLEKNRLSARECRRRKREATENLERQINLLEGENLRLRLQLQIGEEAEETMLKEQSKVTEDIDALLKSGASEADIYATLEEFKEKYADYGKSRRSSIEFHLRNIERLLMPTQTTSVVMQAIKGGSIAAMHHPSNMADAAGTSTVDGAATAAGERSDSIDVAGAVSPGSTASFSVASAHSLDPIVIDPANPNLDPKTLFAYLVNYLDVTPQQAAALKDSRYVAQELDSCLENALSVLVELRNRLAQTGEDLETEFNNVRNILTPTQAAKFLVWVANNSACMHMLNELWDRVYPAAQSVAILERSESKDAESP